MARLWLGGSKTPEPADSAGGTKTCPRCKGNGQIRVVSAKSKEHGGFDPYDEPCDDCGGTGQIPK
jgi:DnaJ-class molecular chaperone